MESVAEKVYKSGANTEVLRLVPKDARVVLDVGCGAGGNAAALRSLGMVIDGITLSDEEAIQARTVCRSVFVHDLEGGLPEQIIARYDCCLCSHVIEHLCRPGSLLADIRRVLTPARGLLIVALPNLLFYKYRLRLLSGRFEYESGGIMDDTHFRWYSFDSARRLLEKEGFEVILARAEGIFPQPFLRRVLGPAGRGLDRLATRWYPGLFGHQLLYVAKPR